MSGVSYLAFVDPSGGSGDGMTLAIGHQEDDVAVLDAIRERRPPFSPGVPKPGQGLSLWQHPYFNSGRSRW
jgi:hypothetical protein